MTAAEITHGLLIEIPKRFPARVWRVNVGAFKDQTGRLVRVNHAGMADIGGIVSPHGSHLQIEVKAGRDKLSDAQISWGRMIETHGGIWLVARDVEQTLAALACLLAERAK
jgi:hypothetical protein